MFVVSVNSDALTPTQQKALESNVKHIDDLPSQLSSYKDELYLFKGEEAINIHIRNFSVARKLLNGESPIVYANSNWKTGIKALDKLILERMKNKNKFSQKKLNKRILDESDKIHGDISYLLGRGFYSKISTKGSYQFNFDQMSKTIVVSGLQCKESEAPSGLLRAPDVRVPTKNGPYKTKIVGMQGYSGKFLYKISDELKSALSYRVNKNGLYCNLELTLNDEIQAEKVEEVVSNKPYDLFGFYRISIHSQSSIPVAELSHIIVAEQTSHDRHKYTHTVGGNNFGSGTPVKYFNEEKQRQKIYKNIKSDAKLSRPVEALLSGKAMVEIRSDLIAKYDITSKQIHLLDTETGFYAIYSRKNTKKHLFFSLEKRMTLHELGFGYAKIPIDLIISGNTIYLNNIGDDVYNSHSLSMRHVYQNDFESLVTQIRDK